MSYDETRVIDAMHPGVVTCPPDTPLRVVARMMARYRIHAVVVTDYEEGEGEEEQPWRVVSSLDIAKTVATGRFDDATAGGSAASELVTVGSDEPVRRAAQLMAEHDIAHLIVTSPDGTSPTGVISTLDLARLAGPT
jgi:CBS domain-containing protein